jgi:hypothetical protein
MKAGLPIADGMGSITPRISFWLALSPFSHAMRSQTRKCSFVRCISCAPFWTFSPPLFFDVVKDWVVLLSNHAHLYWFKVVYLAPEDALENLEEDTAENDES